jgi:hypothetical protein
LAKDSPELFGLPSNIDSLRQRTVSNLVGSVSFWQSLSHASQIVNQLKILMREEVAAEKFDREMWARELAPIMSQWQKFNQAWQSLILLAY